jgi:hypothetical protein
MVWSTKGIKGPYVGLIYAHFIRKGCW